MIVNRTVIDVVGESFTAPAAEKPGGLNVTDVENQNSLGSE
jgi:hypothetical protein